MDFSNRFLEFECFVYLFFKSFNLRNKFVAVLVHVFNHFQEIGRDVLRVVFNYNRADRADGGYVSENVMELFVIIVF